MMRILLVMLLLLFALPASGQPERDIAPNERMKPPDYAEFEKLRQEWLDQQEKRNRENNNAIPNLATPAVVPSGWLVDYDYNQELGAFLQRKYAEGMSANKETVVYLYADWSDACMDFRKSADRKDYQALFQDYQVVMVEYVFLKRMYGARFKKLPVFLKVHESGTIGPELVQPVSNKNEHPRKAFHKVKKFLGSS